MTKAMEFHQAMLDGCVRTGRFGYHPTYFRREVANEGGVAVVKALIAKRRASAGFLRLYQEHHLELSAEAYVITPYYAELFEPDERRWCEAQLRYHDFDVDAFLARVGQDAP